jgi:hypothetical protein
VDPDGDYIGRSNDELNLEPWGDEDTKKLPSVATPFLEGYKEASKQPEDDHIYKVK